MPSYAALQILFARARCLPVNATLSDACLPAARSSVRAEVGDATQLPDQYGRVAGILSCFALQQMPQQSTVLATWVKALAPGMGNSGYVLSIRSGEYCQA